MYATTIASETLTTYKRCFCKTSDFSGKYVFKQPVWTIIHVCICLIQAFFNRDHHLLFQHCTQEMYQWQGYLHGGHSETPIFFFAALI